MSTFLLDEILLLRKHFLFIRNLGHVDFELREAFQGLLGILRFLSNFAAV
jgi:hypothetical protein